MRKQWIRFLKNKCCRGSKHRRIKLNRWIIGSKKARIQLKVNTMQVKCFK